MAISEMFEGFRKLSELAKRVHDAEIKASLMTQILSLQHEAYTRKEAYEQLKKELDQLRDIESKRSELTLRDNAYWMKSGGAEVPYCTACFESRKLLMPLARVSPTRHRGDCPECGAKFNNVFAVPPSEPRPPRTRSRREQMSRI